ncbi:hypothetical protein Tco_0522898 [Tanacetum coccineum]
MAALESCPKHNMIANLEKTEGNVEFHEVIDFLQRSYQFSHKRTPYLASLVSILLRLLSYYLVLKDADGIDTLPNQAIFDAIQLMGYEGDLTDGVLLRKTNEAQPTPSPEPTSEAPMSHCPDSISAQSSEVFQIKPRIELLKAKIKKKKRLKKKATPVKKNWLVHNQTTHLTPQPAWGTDFLKSVDRWFTNLPKIVRLQRSIQIKEPHIYTIWKSGLTRRIQGLDTAYWGFLGVWTTFEIFQNIHILFLEYGVLSLSGYDILSFIPLWSWVSAGTNMSYLP